MLKPDKCSPDEAYQHELNYQQFSSWDIETFPLISVCVFLPLLPFILSLRPGLTRPQTWSELGSPGCCHSVSSLSLLCVVPTGLCHRVRPGWVVCWSHSWSEAGQTQTLPCGRSSSSADKDFNWYFSIMLGLLPLFWWIFPPEILSSV